MSIPATWLDDLACAVIVYWTLYLITVCSCLLYQRNEAPHGLVKGQGAVVTKRPTSNRYLKDKESNSWDHQEMLWYGEKNGKNMHSFILTWACIHFIRGCLSNVQLKWTLNNLNGILGDERKHNFTPMTNITHHCHLISCGWTINEIQIVMVNTASQSV